MSPPRGVCSAAVRFADGVPGSAVEPSGAVRVPVPRAASLGSLRLHLGSFPGLLLSARWSPATLRRRPEGPGVRFVLRTRPAINLSLFFEEANSKFSRGKMVVDIPVEEQ